MAKRAGSTTSAPVLGPDTRVCVLVGKEHLLKREYFNQLRDAIHAAQGEVQTFSYDGRTASLADVFDELRTFGLMQQHKIVVVDEADQFVKTHREAMERYAALPVDHATLVLRCETWHAGNLDKQINKVGAIVKCQPLQPAAARDWVIRRATEEHQRKIDSAAAMKLVQRVGVELMSLDNELAKLALMVEPKQSITAQLIDQLVGRGSDEQAWAVQEAILQALAEPGGSRKPGTHVIEKIHEIVELSGQPDMLVGYFIADTVRKLCLAYQMRRQGDADAHISSVMKLWGTRQQHFFAILRRYNDRQLTQMFDDILRYDVRGKTGLGETMRNLECFCAVTAGASR